MENETQITQDVETTETTEEVVEVDWKAEAEKAKAQVTNLNKALHEARAKKPDDIQALVRKEVEAFERQRVDDDIESIAASLAETPEEKQAILDKYKTRINSTGFTKSAIQNDLQEAKLLANKDKFLAEAEKKARKSVAERSAMTSASVKAAASEEDPDEGDYSEEERKFLERQKALVRK